MLHEEATPPVAASDIPLEEGDKVRASLFEGGGSRRLTEGVLSGDLSHNQAFLLKFNIIIGVPVYYLR